MAFELYPSTLQDNFSKGTFSRVPGNNVVYSNMDVGPTKKRRRSTSSKYTISGSILLNDLTQYNTFDTWFRSTLQDGVKAFYFNDPVTQVQIVVSFKENGMQYRDIGFETYSVQMSLEVINE